MVRVGSKMSRTGARGDGDGDRISVLYSVLDAVVVVVVHCGEKENGRGVPVGRRAGVSIWGSKPGYFRVAVCLCTV